MPNWAYWKCDYNNDINFKKILTIPILFYTAIIIKVPNLRFQ